ncbi:hypothetical protein BO71DRAFT_408151 [Aspergillus ellipticus CBS 707.79]|uniref:Uncharacterized protein n=1 Tax=Aspergillus ellipticus CBS 707.79 TaxID=1448320 RepID=A0A319E5J2_9EURO|nr:hypothetical protein BO71DRAFT_408151 [Aspergillus ellipticus CBS 707.79]
MVKGNILSENFGYIKKKEILFHNGLGGHAFGVTPGRSSSWSEKSKQFLFFYFILFFYIYPDSLFSLINTIIRSTILPVLPDYNIAVNKIQIYTLLIYILIENLSKVLYLSWRQARYLYKLKYYIRPCNSSEVSLRILLLLRPGSSFITAYKLIYTG